MGGDVEDLVGRFDAPVSACGEQPLSGGQSAERHTGQEVAVIVREDGIVAVEGDALDAQDGAQMSPIGEAVDDRRQVDAADNAAAPFDVLCSSGGLLGAGLPARGWLRARASAVTT